MPVTRRRDASLLALALAVLAYAAGLALDLPTLRLAAKPLPALALAWWTAGAPGAALVTTGLVFSAVGDLTLDLGTEPAFFLAGMAAFAVAHAAYVAAFLAHTRRPRLLALLPFLLWGVVLLRMVGAGLGPLVAPVCAYAVLLVAMMWRATAASLEAGRWVAAAGAVLFGLSDSLIALDRFHAPVPGARWLIMALYWTGQLGIARSALEASPERILSESPTEER